MKLLFSNSQLALLLLTAASFSVMQSASAQTAIKLYNTGVNNDGTLAAAGTVDQHYTQVTPTGNPAAYVSDAFGYAASSTNSQYISPDTSAGSVYQGGVYTVDYQTTFDLTGLNPATTVITGAWSTDNFGSDILINGHSTGLTSSTFTSFTDFNLTPFQNDFQSGVNTLDFVWTNTNGAGALNVENLQGTALPPPAVPEASTTVSLGLLLALGLGGVAVAARRKKMTA